MEVSPEVLYKFCFADSNQFIHLTESQVNCIPYLSTLIVNENAEYLLPHPIQYTWFMIILRAITLKQAHILFTELADAESIAEVLKLYDYLLVKVFSPPPLKRQNFRPRNRYIDDPRVETFAQVRNTAAQFVLALSQKAYDLNDWNIVQCIFSRLLTIFSKTDAFNSRFRNQTLIIVNDCCISLFSQEQRDQLPTNDEIRRNSPLDSLLYQDDDDQPVSEHLENIFAWQSPCEPFEHFLILCRPRLFGNNVMIGKSSILRSFVDYDPLNSDELDSIPAVFKQRTFQMYHTEYKNNTLDARSNFLDPRALLTTATAEMRAKEAESARSGHFNTLPKRPSVDRFKHRSGPKAPKPR